VENLYAANYGPIVGVGADTNLLHQSIFYWKGRRAQYHMHSHCHACPLHAPPSPATPGSAVHSFTCAHLSAAFLLVQALCLGMRFCSFLLLYLCMCLCQLPLLVPGLLVSKVLGLNNAHFLACSVLGLPCSTSEK